MNDDISLHGDSRCRRSPDWDFKGEPSGGGDPIVLQSPDVEESSSVVVLEMESPEASTSSSALFLSVF